MGNCDPIFTPSTESLPLAKYLHNLLVDLPYLLHVNFTLVTIPLKSTTTSVLRVTLTFI